MCFAMRSRSVAIHNFRAVGDVTIRIHDYTLLVGANGIGMEKDKRNAI